MDDDARFSTELFRFLRDLAANNERAWFEENRERYERHVRQPALRFIEAFGSRLADISSHFVADPRPAGGSLFRIYRDTRFSRDKRPYKTHVGIRFSHEAARDVHAPGYYLHIEAEEVWMACGIWRPDAGALRRIRTAIVEDPGAWERAKGDRRFARSWTLSGHALKTAPRGFDRDHPLIEDLRRKDFIGAAPLPKETLTDPALLAVFAGRCRDAEPLQRFLCRALELPY